VSEHDEEHEEWMRSLHKRQKRQDIAMFATAGALAFWSLFLIVSLHVWVFSSPTIPAGYVGTLMLDTFLVVVALNAWADDT
jgi:hypothetical protein